MKNIYVLPTNKPSRLLRAKSNGNIFLDYHKDFIFDTEHWEYLNIYIINDENIKKGYWFMNIKSLSLFKHYFEEGNLYKECKKIIITTDLDLIKDDVQAIDDEFLEWFVKNPSCEEIEVRKGYKNAHSSNTVSEFYKIFIPKEIGFKVENGKRTETYYEKEEPKQGTLEEFINSQPYYGSCTTEYLEGIEEGVKWQQERSYSEEEVLEFLLEFMNDYSNIPKEWLEQFKKK